MSRETVEMKALRLVSEGRVEIRRGNRQEGLASVQGDTGFHLVSWDPTGSICLCPAKTGCSHVAAVSLFLDHQPKGETMPEPTDENETIEDLGPEPGELAVVEDDPNLLPVDSTPTTFQMLRSIADTEFVPAAIRGRPFAILAAVRLGSEWGLGPMESLRQIDIIDGRASPSAELLNRLARQRGHRIETLEATDEVCRLRGVRGDNGEEMEIVFTIADAERAGLLSRPAWRQWPSDMLFARCVSRLSRRLFPDLTNGVGPEQPIEGEGGSDL